MAVAMDNGLVSNPVYPDKWIDCKGGTVLWLSVTISRKRGTSVTYDFLVFDLDGTLSDPKEGILHATNDALSAFGYAPIDANTVGAYIGPRWISPSGRSPAPQKGTISMRSSPNIVKHTQIRDTLKTRSTRVFCHCLKRFHKRM